MAVKLSLLVWLGSNPMKRAGLDLSRKLKHNHNRIQSFSSLHSSLNIFVIFAAFADKFEMSTKAGFGKPKVLNKNGMNDVLIVYSLNESIPVYMTSSPDQIVTCEEIVRACSAGNPDITKPSTLEFASYYNSFSASSSTLNFNTLEFCSCGEHLSKTIPLK